MGGSPRDDFSVLTEQLGRAPTTRFDVLVRCEDGHPLVIRDHPVDAAGAPFPTLYWLTCPDAVRAVSRLESSGAIGEFNARAEADEGFARALRAAHEEYARERARFHAEALGWGGVGGTRTGVKCLHAQYANHLAGGDDPVGAWVARRVEPVHDAPARLRVGAIDQGTNSIRLLVAGTAADGSAREISRDMIITRLGEDVDRTGRIAPEALARTLGVLERYGRRARALHAERIHMIATSAVRDAANRADLAEPVRRITGEDLEIITGEREAALSFAGATGGLTIDGRILMLDIGGGSTEFVVGESSPHRALSTQMGSVRLTERFVRSDPARAEEREAARAEIDRVLAETWPRLSPGGATLIAVAGTATTVQAIALDLDRYEPARIHGTRLPLGTAEQVCDRLWRMTVAEKARLAVMPPGRADVIAAGAEVLVAVMRRGGYPEAVVSEEDILDGLAAELLATR